MTHDDITRRLRKSAAMQMPMALTAEECEYLATLAQQGKVVVTRDEDGEIVMVSRQDGDGKLSCVIASTTHAGGKLQGKAGGVPAKLLIVRQKLQRFAECAEDGDGCDIGRDWFDALTTIGLLERTKRSPAEWMMTSAGHDLLAALAPQPKDAT